MTLLIISSDKDTGPWVEALAAADSSVEVKVWPDSDVEAQDVEFVLSWNHPGGVLRQFANLRAVNSMGAGIDHFVDDPYMPNDVACARLVDPSLAQSMFEYILAAAMYYHRGLDRYRRQQNKGQWRAIPHRSMAESTIGIMGLGELGEYAAARLASIGFKVVGWARSPKQIVGVETYTEPELETFLGRADILVCLLPLTRHTQGILNVTLFSSLPADACLINVARGGHLVESDLLQALADGSVRGACLDVFQHEPLPAEHPFWKNDRIVITPHSSSITDPVAVAPQILENYRRALRGAPLLNEVDIIRGY